MHTSEPDEESEKTDLEYVQQCRNGHPEDFRFLVQRHQRLLFAFLVRRVGGDRSLAEDATQESLLRAFTALPKLKKPESFQAWLLGIAGRVAHEFNRVASRQADVSEPPEPAVAPSESPEDYHLEEAIANLPELHRRLILLRYYEGLSCQEAAERLGMPLGSVTKTLSRAYSELRKLLASRAAIETPVY